jgi:hypothetical protein
MTEPGSQFSITLAQLNPTVGDVSGNAAKARAARAQAKADGGDLVVLPELSAGRSGAETGIPGGLPLGGRGTGARDRRWRAGNADRQSLG